MYKDVTHSAKQFIKAVFRSFRSMAEMLQVQNITNLDCQEHGRGEASAECNTPLLKGWLCIWLGAAKGWGINCTPYAGGATALPIYCAAGLPELWPPLLLPRP